ncbi:tripartite tricarboxylate transporter TctB family protein [Psychromonas sp. SA13A]|uniref:tripartite tricarboxylate transporter TctB family protein n=1 Tax=Psychromonas sp. SA13A TaxID=2686346 RepID=UPI001408F793|nr:tripartite tricarboxylate transporter TctB family protein [Psychromonas sp. SA13A]
MKLKNRTDLAVAVIAVLFGIGLYYLSSQLASPFSMGVGMPSEGYPQLLGILMVIIGLIIAIESMFNSKTSSFSVSRFLPLSFILFALFTYNLDSLGFIFSCTILLCAIMLLAGERNKFRLFAIPSGLTVFVFTLVYLGFNIILPLGFLNFLYE